MNLPCLSEPVPCSSHTECHAASTFFLSYCPPSSQQPDHWGCDRNEAVFEPLRLVVLRLEKNRNPGPSRPGFWLSACGIQSNTPRSFRSRIRNLFAAGLILGFT